MAVPDLRRIIALLGAALASIVAAVRMKGLAVRRIVLPAVTGALMIGILTGCNPGGLLGCQPVAPRELPSGAAPGTGIEGVAGGYKQFVWGEGLDRVELWVGGGMGVGDRPLHQVMVRGHEATVYQARVPGQATVGLAWSEGDCEYTVFLDQQRDPQDLADYAGRY